MNINDLLNQNCSKNITTAWTWQSFQKATAAFSVRLQVASPPCVALWFNDAARFSSALFAAWQAGIKVLLPPQINVENQDWIKREQAIIISDDINIASPNFYYSSEDEKAISYTNIQFTISPNAQLTLKTSGSSGEPKYIKKTCSQLCSEAEAIQQALPQDWRQLLALSSVSQQHLYGLSFRIFSALACDWQIAREQIIYPETFIQTSNIPCIWISSPTLLNHFTLFHNWESIHQTLKGIISAGGMLPTQTRQLFQNQTSVPLIDIYGSSETGVIAWRKNKQPTWQLFSSVKAGTNAQDLLWVQSPWTISREQTADQVQLENSSLKLLGRQDRIIKFADKRISLVNLEQQLLQHEWVSDAHCAIVKKHQRIAAWVALNRTGLDVLLTQGGIALQHQLKQWLATCQESLALPRYWRWANELPRDSQSKIRDYDFQKQFIHSEIAPQWQILEQSDMHAIFVGRVPLNLASFAGHFTHFPLVAGAVQLQWVITLVEALNWPAFSVGQIEQLKFQQFIRPNDLIHLHLQYEHSKDKYLFQIYQGDKICASGRWQKAE